MDSRNSSGSDDPKSGGREIDGMQALIDMFNVMEPEARDKLLAQVAARDPKLVETIRKRMFGFEDLVRLSDADFQVLLREIEPRILAIALRKCGADLKAAFLRNMPNRARQAIEDEMAMIGPQRVADVQAAQARIVEAAKKIAENGGFSREV